MAEVVAASLQLTALIKKVFSAQWRTQEPIGLATSHRTVLRRNCPGTAGSTATSSTNRTQGAASRGTPTAGATARRLGTTRAARGTLRLGTPAVAAAVF